MNNKLRDQYCLEKGGINPSNIIEWYYIEWLEYKLTEALKQSDNSEFTEEQLKGLGFELTKQYEHDEFHTNRYAKGILEVEFTYESQQLVTCDLTISELNCKPVTFDEMKALTTILGDWKDC